MKTQQFIQLLIRECNGLVGALRISVDAVTSFIFKVLTISEDELVVYYLSRGCLEQMARCFGSKHTIPSVALQQFLIKCLVTAPNIGSLAPQLADEDNRYLVGLKKAGFLVEDGDQLVKFSSPLAEKYYCKWLFPNRADRHPSSVLELITKVVGNMSASVLQGSVVDGTYFPKEATFQLMFMEGIALNTHPTCVICPELSRVYPSSSADDDQPPRIQGAIDFYLNGTLRWGLELLVNGSRIGQRAARFASDGKYAPLDVRDYAVIDLRGNETGEVTGTTLMEKRATVFFKLGDFTDAVASLEWIRLSMKFY